MSEDYNVVQLHLNTDSTVSTLVSTLVGRGLMASGQIPGPHVKHVRLTCSHPDCGRTFSEEVNKTTKYALPIAHSLEHRCKAGELMQEAVWTKKTHEWLESRKPGETEYRSPPAKRAKQRSTPSSPSGTTTVPERSLSSMELKEQCIKEAAYMLATTYVSFKWFTNPTVKRMFSAMSASYTPSEHDVIGAVKRYGGQCLDAVLVHLRESNEPCTMAVDAVTNVNHHKIYSVVLLSSGRAWFYSSWSIRMAADTALLAFESLCPMLQELQTRGVRVSALTTDSASSMRNLRELIYKRFGVIGIGCAAHLIHNTAMKLIEGLDEVLTPFNALLEQYRDDKQLRRGLDDTEGTKLVRKNDTRWSSHLYALQSIKRNKERIQSLDVGRINCSITEENWTALDAIIIILKEFEVRNKLVQADDATLITYYLAMVDLLKYLQQLRSNSAADVDTATLTKHDATFRLTMLYINRWLPRVDPYLAVPTAAYLARIKSTELGCNAATARIFFKDHAEKLLKRCNVQLPTTNLLNKLDNQMTAMESGRGVWYVDKADQSLSATTTFKDAAVWYGRRLTEDKCMPLAALAVILLTMTPSEASVERTFSCLKMQWTAKRNRLDVSTVNNLLRLQLNPKRLDEVNHLAPTDQPSAKYCLVTSVTLPEEEEEQLPAAEGAEPAAE